MKITLLYQVSHYIRVKKQRNIKSWDQQNYLVIRGFCYIRPRYNEVPLHFDMVDFSDHFNHDNIHKSIIFYQKKIEELSKSQITMYISR